ADLKVCTTTAYPPARPARPARPALRARTIALRRHPSANVTRSAAATARIGARILELWPRSRIRVDTALDPRQFATARAFNRRLAFGRIDKKFERRLCYLRLRRRPTESHQPARDDESHQLLLHAIPRSPYDGPQRPVANI